ncbi:hypothetical protein D9611_003105 [Ephemerocybe angulata]|uniref:Uncharacterized protein n=1 Tax=Ephemerocybe angulata TaxID=980116 RepID=A0A8H5CA19_9AGAR|nr:hypothetical protein D9611_003105 [Tulosesus angulatus]
MIFTLTKLAQVALSAAVAALLVSQSALGRAIHRRSEVESGSEELYGRALEVETLDGSLLDPIVIDYLDQLEIYTAAVNKTEKGTELYEELVDQTSTISSMLSFFMEDYATFVQVPDSTSTSTADIPLSTAVGEDPLPTSTAAETQDEPAPTPTPAPTATSDKPVITTVIPQSDTSVVIPASQGTTTTVTRTGAATATVSPSGKGGEEQVPRSSSTASTSTRGGFATAAGSTTEVLRNSAFQTASTSLLIPVGLAAGLLMTVL